MFDKLQSARFDGSKKKEFSCVAEMIHQDSRYQTAVKENKLENHLETESVT